LIGVLLRARRSSEKQLRHCADWQRGQRRRRYHRHPIISDFITTTIVVVVVGGSRHGEFAQHIRPTDEFDVSRQIGRRATKVKRTLEMRCSQRRVARRIEPAVEHVVEDAHRSSGRRQKAGVRELSTRR